MKTISTSKVINTILNLKDNYSKGLITAAKNTKQFQRELRIAGQKASELKSKVTTAVKGIAAVTGGVALKTGLSEAFDLEGYKVQLETATKSTEKAAEIMKYSIDLANKTPFEGGEMVEASSKLEAMGISAKDYLSNIVDMAAATNKPLDQATEAFIDAQTGELERLKEFGVKKADIQKKANEMFAGQETINAKGQITNQENFNKALLAIMQDRYAGGAEKLAGTTKGMLSTVTGITKSALSKIVGIQEDGTIKAGSLIDKIKEKVKSLADKLTEWQSDGTLDNIANKAVEIFTKIYNIVSYLINFIINHKDIILTIASMAVTFSLLNKAIKGISIAVNIFKLAWAILNGTIALTPIGWIIIGITALVGAFVLAYQHSETFRNAVNNAFAKIKDAVMVLYQTFSGVFSSLKAWLAEHQELVQGLKNAIMASIQGALDFVSNSISTLADLFSKSVDFIADYVQLVKDIFSGNWEAVWEDFKNVVRDAIELVKSWWNGLKDLIQQPIKTSINVIKSVFGGNDNTGENATGTNRWNGGWTTVGEHGTELIKLPQGAQVKSHTATVNALNNSNGQQPVIVNVYGTVIGSEDFADMVGQHVYDKVRLAYANVK